MAGNQGAIDDVVRESALKQLDDLTAKANAAEAQIVSLTKAAIELNAATGNSRSFRDYNNNAAKAATETAKLQKAQQDLARATVLLQQAEQRLAAMTNQTAISQQNLERATLRTQQAQDKAAQSAAKALAPYQQLVNVHKALVEEARNAGIQFGLNSTQYIQAANQANGVGERLNTINNSLGNYSNNVGNYTRGIADYFQRFYSGIRIAANIIPGLGISGIFLLAFEGIKYVVEQLGLFNDKISQAKANLDAYNEVSKAANQEAGKQSSNLRILYQAATDVTNSIHNRTLAARELQKEFPDTFKNITTETILNGGASASYQQLTKDIIANAKAKAVADKLGKIEADLFDSDVQTQKVRNAQSNEERRSIDYYTKALVGQGLAYDKAREAASKATFEQSKYEAQVRKAGGVVGTTTDANDPRGVNGELNAIRARANDAIKAEQEKQKVLKNTRDFLIKLAGGNNAVAAGIAQNDTPKEKVVDTSKEDFNLNIKAAKDADQEIQKNETSTFDERIASAEKFKKDTFKIIYDAEVARTLTAKQAASERADIEKAYQADFLKINQDAQKELKALYDKQVQDAKDFIELKRKTLEATNTKATSNLLDEAQQNADDQLQILVDQYEKGEITIEEYNRRKSELEKQSSLNSQAITISGLEALIAIRKQFGLDESDDEKKLADLKRKLSKDTTDAQISDLERLNAEKKKGRDAEKDAALKLGNELITLTKTVVDAQFQNQLNAVQDQKDTLDDQTKAQIDAENRSLDSAATKADKIAVINAKAAAQQAQLDEKARQIKQKQAQADRIFTIASIIENTAIGVSKALATYIFPYSAIVAGLVGALGAAQIATVLATPIPKYEKGTDNAKGGLSIVGEAGREYVLPPSGDGFFTPDSASFMDIPKGSKVIPHHELFTILSNPFKPQIQNSDRSDKRMIEAMNRGNDKLVRAVKGSKGRTTVYVDTLRANAHNNKRNVHFK